MDDPAMTPDASTSPSEASAPCPVAETMLRIHRSLRDGFAPSYEALLAFGEPQLR
jgi:hypothetical protein